MDGRTGKRLQTYEGDGITVTFDPNICIHSGVCARTLFAVFDPYERRWVRLEKGTAAEIAATIDKCPSTALKYTIKPKPAGE